MRRKSRKSEPEAKSGSSESDENQANGAENEDAASESGERDAKRRRSEKKTPRKPAKADKRAAKEKPEDQADDDDDDEEEQYEVEAVVDSKTVRNVKHYLIRWKGYDASSDTWEIEGSLNCPDLIKAFEENRGSPDKSKKRAKHGGRKGKPERVAGPDSADYDENAEYEVDRIIEVHHKRSGKKEFLVSWKGYPQSQNSWVDEEDMDCKDLIAKFMAKVERAKNTSPKELRENRAQTDRFTLTTREIGRRLSRRNKGKQRVQYHNAE